MGTLREDAIVIEKILHLIQKSNCTPKNKKNMADAMYFYASYIGAKIRPIKIESEEKAHGNKKSEVNS